MLLQTKKLLFQSCFQEKAVKIIQLYCKKRYFSHALVFFSVLALSFIIGLL